MMAFCVEERLGTVHVLAAFLLVLVHCACCVADDTPELVLDGNHKAVIIETEVVAFL